jgi:FkbM family methyltransferase
MSATQTDWRADPRFFSLEERLKYALVPPRLYLANLAKRNLKKGEPELHALGRLVRPGGLSLDIGANKGVYSYLMAGISDRVAAFEPNPKMFWVLSRCVPRNVDCHNVALSNSDGEAEMILPVQRSGRYSNQGGTLQSRKMEDSDKELGSIRVAQRRLDSYDLRDVTFIKIDVEGFEFEVLEGARDTLARERPVLLIEIDASQNKRPLEDAIRAVCDYGYTAHFVRGGAEAPFAEYDPGRARSSNFVFRPA